MVASTCTYKSLFLNLCMTTPRALFLHYTCRTRIKSGLHPAARSTMFFQSFVTFCLLLSGAKLHTAAHKINVRQGSGPNPYASVSLERRIHISGPGQRFGRQTDSTNPWLTNLLHLLNFRCRSLLLLDSLGLHVSKRTSSVPYLM